MPLPWVTAEGDLRRVNADRKSTNDAGTNLLARVGETLSYPLSTVWFMGAVVVPVDAMASLAGADVAASSPSDCSALLGHVRLVRGWLDSVEAHITSRVTEHHAAGQSAPAADTHTQQGRVSAAEGRRKERRSKAINDSPRFGDALAGGEIGAEHVDALAAATSRLDDAIKAELLGQEDLLDVARSESPEKFGQAVRDRARTLEADAGIERNKQQRKQTFLSHKINHETGMHEGRFALHPELGSRIFSAIDRQVLKNIKAGAARGESEFVDRTFDYSQQSAQALGDIVTAANSREAARSAPAPGSTADRDHAGPGQAGPDPACLDHACRDLLDDRPENDGPEDDPADNDGADGADNDGADNDGADNDGADNDGADNDGADNDGADNDGADCDRMGERDAGAQDRDDGAGHGVSRGDLAGGEVARDRGSRNDPADQSVLDAGESRGIEADITVIIDYTTLVSGEFHDHSVSETSYGAVLPPASVQRLLCNGSVTPVVLDPSGNPFNLGRTVRHASRKQRRALRSIYRSCGFPCATWASGGARCITFVHGNSAG
jgi:hypothetical protein